MFQTNNVRYIYTFNRQNIEPKDSVEKMEGLEVPGRGSQAAQARWLVGLLAMDHNVSSTWFLLLTPHN